MKRLTVGLMVLALMIVGTAGAEAGPMIGIIDLENLFVDPRSQEYYQSKIEGGEPIINYYKTWDDFKGELVSDDEPVGYRMKDVIGAVEEYKAEVGSLPSKLHFAFIGFDFDEEVGLEFAYNADND